MLKFNIKLYYHSMNLFKKKFKLFLLQEFELCSLLTQFICMN